MIQGVTAAIICEECARGAVEIIDKRIVDVHVAQSKSSISE